MFKSIIDHFDKLEDDVRVKLSHRSVLYALIGGMVTILFWRGIWHTADILMAKGDFLGWFFYEPITLIWSGLILLFTGLFVSNLIGERIVISGQKKETKATDKAVVEVDKEESEINIMRSRLAQISKDVEEIKNVIIHK